jgi:integrase
LRFYITSRPVPISRPSRTGPRGKRDLKKGNSYTIYREFLGIDIGEEIDTVRVRRYERLPTVMSKEETLRVLGALNEVRNLMGMLLYISGLRFMDCVLLRVQSIDFRRSHIINRDDKGAKDRVTVLPKSVNIAFPTTVHGIRLEYVAPCRIFISLSFSNEHRTYGVGH